MNNLLSNAKYIIMRIKEEYIYIYIYTNIGGDAAAAAVGVAGGDYGDSDKCPEFSYVKFRATYIQTVSQ